MNKHHTGVVAFCAAVTLSAAGVLAQATWPASAAPAPGGTAAGAGAAAPQPEAIAPEHVGALAGRPDVEGEELLGGTFQAPLAGIAFRTPAGLAQVKTSGDEVGRFNNPTSGWELVCVRSSTAQPLPLSSSADAAAADGAPKQMGLLEIVSARLKQANPGADIVRQEVVNLGEFSVGLLAARLSSVNQRKLHQQAIVQANDQLYYTLTMTAPAAKDAKGPDSDDPGERIAVESFRQMLDTVKLLDRGVIKQDQNERLFRTRALFVTMTPKKLRQVLIPEQWTRLIRDGKDIGYTYIVEEPDDKGGGDGIRIGIRSRSYPDANTQIDGETWFIVTGDRRHENWSNLVWIQNLKSRIGEQITEMGSSDRSTKRIAVGAGPQPSIQPIDVYELEVKTIGKTATAEPVKRQLPPFYLPQALGHLLPRLLPLREPKTYLFATYVGDRREVMMRYVDVGLEQRVELDGEKVLAVPITDRLGLEGSPTTHYVSPEGRYLGSVNKDSKITILPSTAADLQAKWQNADLSRPKDAPAAPQAPRPVAGEAEAVGRDAVKR